MLILMGQVPNNGYFSHRWTVVDGFKLETKRHRRSQVSQQDVTISIFDYFIA